MSFRGRYTIETGVQTLLSIYALEQQRAYNKNLFFQPKQIAKEEPGLEQQQENNLNPNSNKNT